MTCSQNFRIFIHGRDVMSVGRQHVCHPTTHKASTEDQDVRHGPMCCTHPFILSPSETQPTMTMVRKDETRFNPDGTSMPPVYLENRRFH